MAPNVPDDQENEKLCACPSCPTYSSSKFSSNVFCARGKATAKVIAKGCNCPSCPVTQKYGLTKTYFCMTGKA